jgi:hypothetical protein
MITVYCKVKTLVGRLGHLEKTFLAKRDFDFDELLERRHVCFAKLIDAALHDTDIKDEDIEADPEWPLLKLVQRRAVFTGGSRTFGGHVATKEWVAGFGVSKDVALYEFGLVD